MHFASSEIIALAIVLVLGATSLVKATPLPCSDAVIDLILVGELDSSACCSYGVCKGDVNVQGGRVPGRLNRQAPLGILRDWRRFGVWREDPEDEDDGSV